LSTNYPVSHNDNYEDDDNGEDDDKA